LILAHGPAIFDRGDRRTELRVEVRRVHEPEEGALRIGVADDEPGADLLAGLEPTPRRGRRPVLPTVSTAAPRDQDARHRRALAHRPPPPASTDAQRLRDGSHAALHVSHEALRQLVAAESEWNTSPDAVPGSSARRGAEHVGAGDEVLHLVALEARVDQVDDAGGQEPDQAAGVALTDLPRPRQQPEQTGRRRRPRRGPAAVSRKNGSSCAASRLISASKARKARASRGEIVSMPAAVLRGSCQ
jgi:hypothetical protein